MVQQSTRATGHEIEIDGTFNGRWAADSGLLRSANLDDLTPAGRNALRDLGIRLVIDLRAAAERSTVEHGVPVAHHPLFENSAPATGTLEDVYDNLLLTRGAALAGAVAAIADADGPVLVHCAVGKDRTGLVVALALLAAGISVDDVVADYALSGDVVRARRREAVIADLGARGLDDDAHAHSVRLHLDSPAEALHHALVTLDGLGGATTYLRTNGLTEGQLTALRLRITASSGARGTR
jgi:protein-tyrosine phosphatase